jgi:HPt (histidine-containing phosphotransfer) domain-containing protein
MQQWHECECIFNIIEQQQLEQNLLSTLNYWRTNPPKKKQNSIDGAVLLDERVLNNLQKTAPDLLPMFLMEFIQEVQIREQNLLHCATEQAWQQVIYEAHALKGVSANFGAVQLAELAGEIEQDARALTPKKLTDLLEQVPPLAEQTIAAVMIFLEQFDMSS